MTNKITVERQTKYCQAIEHELLSIGHATNAELLSVLRKSFPNLSATTVHRATTRLAARCKITIAPSANNGSIQYDANIIPHDHFQCSICGTLRDANIKDKIIPIIEASIGDCSISGQLTINGVCKKCIQKNKE